MYHLLALSLAPLLYSNTVHAIQRGCDVRNAKLELPAGQTELVLEPNIYPVSIAQGLGSQNYTCSSSGTYTSTGAVAEMYDLSCLVAEALAQGVSYQTVSGPTWKRDANNDDLLSDNLRLGCHYFIPDPTDPHNVTKNIPEFDWNCGGRGILSTDPNGFMKGVKAAALPSPDNSTFDVAWVQVKGTSGDLASFVYRVNTHGGNPPAKCTPGTPDIEVPYTAMYWLFQNASSYHPLAGGSGASTSTTTTTITTTVNYGTTAYYATSRPLSSSYLHWSSSTPAPTYAKAAELNAAVSSDSSDSDSDDDAKIQKLLNYAPVAIALLAIATLLSLTALIISFVYVCRRRRGGAMPTRSVPAYHPIQLPRSSQPVMEESYHDEIKRYDP